MEFYNYEILRVEVPNLWKVSQTFWASSEETISQSTAFSFQRIRHMTNKHSKSLKSHSKSLKVPQSLSKPLIVSHSFSLWFKPSLVNQTKIQTEISVYFSQVHCKTAHTKSPQKLFFLPPHTNQLLEGLRLLRKWLEAGELDDDLLFFLFLSSALFLLSSSSFFFLFLLFFSSSLLLLLEE